MKGILLPAAARTLLLRPHQKEALKAPTDAFAAGEERVTVVSACGTGKTQTEVEDSLPECLWRDLFVERNGLCPAVVRFAAYSGTSTVPAHPDRALSQQDRSHPRRTAGSLA